MKEYTVKIKSDRGRIVKYYYKADDLTAAKHIAETLFTAPMVKSIPKEVVEKPV